MHSVNIPSLSRIYYYTSLFIFLITILLLSLPLLLPVIFTSPIPDIVENLPSFLAGTILFLGAPMLLIGFVIRLIFRDNGLGAIYIRRGIYLNLLPISLILLTVLFSV